MFFGSAEDGTAFNNTGLEKSAAPSGKIRLQAQRVMARSRVQAGATGAAQCR